MKTSRFSLTFSWPMYSARVRGRRLPSIGRSSSSLCGVITRSVICHKSLSNKREVYFYLFRKDLVGCAPLSLPYRSDGFRFAPPILRLRQRFECPLEKIFQRRIFAQGFQSAFERLFCLGWPIAQIYQG